MLTSIEDTGETPAAALLGSAALATAYRNTPLPQPSRVCVRLRDIVTASHAAAGAKSTSRVSCIGE
jgi:hypothetical protein